MLGLDVAHCSGCTGESSSAPSPDPLPVMAEVHLVCTGQRAFHRGRCGDPLTVLGGSSYQQQSASLEGGRPETSRGLSPSDSSQGGESGLSGGVTQAWST